MLSSSRLQKVLSECGEVQVRLGLQERCWRKDQAGGSSAKVEEGSYARERKKFMKLRESEVR
jgi:hypothetical protein